MRLVWLAFILEKKKKAILKSGKYSFPQQELSTRYMYTHTHTNTHNFLVMSLFFS